MASFSYGVSVYGGTPGRIEFAAISDGKQTKFMFPAGTPEEEIEERLISFGIRLDVAKDLTDPEEIVQAIGYNMGVELQVSDDVDTFEEAVERVRNLLSAEDDFETTEFELYDSKLPEDYDGED